MLNDPIADYLTRIRNALGSGHDDVQIPASRLKEEMTRILKEQGYILDFARKPDTVGEAIEIKIKYTEDRRPAPRDCRPRADLAAGPAALRRSHRSAQGRRGYRHGDHQHLGRCDDRP